MLAAVAAGGAIGAAARYGIEEAWPTTSGQLPAGTLAINVTGCALIGILVVLTSEVRIGHRLLRPFLGTGVLGGFTTFSTYAVDIQQLGSDGHWGIALAYLVLTPVGALLAVWLASAVTRRLIGANPDGTGDVRAPGPSGNDQ